MLTLHKLHIIIIIIGSCVELVGVIGGCCESSCSAQGCYCDQVCYQFNDCCPDIEDIGCQAPGMKMGNVYDHSEKEQL